MTPDNFPAAPDWQARDAAVLETSKNIIVEAGAGTGKTTLLTDRLCYLILGKSIPIDRIIALTFTEKAAAEIKSRLLDKMGEVRRALKGESEPSPQTAELIKKLPKDKQTLIKEIEKNFELAERAVISTIHGFCFKILKRFPAEAGTAPDLTADAQNSAEAVTDKIWSAFLDEELNYGSPNAALWEELLSECALEDIKDFALSLLKQPLLNYRPDLKNPETAKALRANAKSAEDLLSAYKSKRKNAFEQTLAQAIKVLNNAAQYHEGSAFENINMPPSKNLSRPTAWKDNNDFEQAKNIIELAENASPKNTALLKTAKAVLNGFLPKAREALRKSNLISFDEMILRTRDLVKNHLHIRQTLKEEYQSILLDEFQDTDPEQGEIFLYLSEARDSQAKDWRDILLEQGKLFIVGDPKQSIYRFRGADIAAYDVFTDTLLKQGALKCFLQSNFRSSEEIVAYANKFGRGAIKEEREIQPRYVPIKHTKAYNAAPVRLIIAESENDKLSAADARRFQADIIVKWIKENAFKTRLTDGRIMTYKDIAVLYRSAAGLSFLIEALKQASIDYSVEENKNFYQTQEIKDILNILKLAIDPSDRTALTGVLRGPLCLVKDEDILKLSEANALDIYTKSGAEYIDYCFDMLKEICRRAQTMPTEEFINYLLSQTRFKQMQFLCGGGEQISANLSKFLDIARGFSSRGILTLPQLIHHMEFYFKREEKEGESPLAEESLDSVKLMSVHKSKGLQFPAVIIYDINRDDRKGNKPAPLYLSDWLTASAAPRLGKIKDLSYCFMQQKNEKHAKAEERRILYVALTRAEERLLILGTRNAQNTLAAPLLEAGCYPGEDRPAELLNGLCKISYIPYSGAGEDSPAFKPKRTSPPPPDIKNWQNAWLKRNERYDSSFLETSSSPSAAARAALDGEASSSAMLIGRICHRLLCQILQKQEALSLNNIAVIEGADPSADSAEIAEAQRIIDEFKKSEAFKKLAGMRLLATELPFALKEHQNAPCATGVIDAVFADANGGVFIAEFKSDKINEERLEEASGKYAPQLEAYIKAARLIFNNDKVSGALIFLRTKQIRRLGDI